MDSIGGCVFFFWFYDANIPYTPGNKDEALAYKEENENNAMIF